MKFQASATFHGRRMTRGCVVTRRNSYKIDHVVYQASARARWTLQPIATAGVELRIRVGGVDQDVGIDQEHYRPSIAWYKASGPQRTISVPPL